MALNGADIQAVGQIGQRCRVPVHHGDVVALAGEVLRQGTADLPRTEDNDFHGPKSFPDGCPDLHRRAKKKPSWAPCAGGS